MKLLKYSALGMVASCGASLLGLPASAHHSYSATYDPERTITVEGQLVSFTLRNPHTMVFLLAEDETGATHRWAIEWGAATLLRSEGIEGDSLKTGDHIIVTGLPGRQVSARRMLLRAVERPSDGWSWSGDFD